MGLNRSRNLMSKKSINETKVKKNTKANNLNCNITKHIKPQKYSSENSEIVFCPNCNAIFVAKIQYEAE